MRIKYWVSFFLVLAMILPGCSASLEEKKTEREIFAMDTIMKLTFYGENGEQAMPVAISEIQKMEKMFSVTNNKSEISKINEAKGEKVTVSKETYDLLSACIQFGKDTEGLFDISIYPLVKLWGFTTEKYRVPDKTERDAVIQKIDYKKIELLPNYQVRIPSGMAIDLGAAAKGYLSQKIIDICKAKKVTSCILSLGGNVQTIGVKPDHSEYTVGITDPSDGSSIYGTLHAKDKAVITSGIYQRNFKKDGKLYHHIMDKRTGMPAENNLASVTVIANNGAMADAYATALSVMGEKKAIEFQKKHPQIQIILIRKDGTFYQSEKAGMVKS